MKIKLSIIPIFLILNDVFVSIPNPGILILQPGLNFESIRVFGFSFSGAVRLIGIPILSFIILDSVKKRGLKKEVVIFLIPMICLFMTWILQFFVIPKDAIPMHSTGVVRYISWSLEYISLLLILNQKNSLKIVTIFATTLTILFFLLIIQYPAIILNSKYSFSDVIQLYGTIKMNGIWGGANEDANGAMTLLPFFLAYTEQKKGWKRVSCRIFAFIICPTMIFFNGTRTALIFIYPLVLFLFYSNLSIKKIIKFSPILIILGMALQSVGGRIAETTFSNDLEGGGTSGWRIEHVWTPAFNYALDTSPILGFGVRGWEYVSSLPGVLSVTEEGGASPHNIYLWIFISWGLVGLIFYFSLLIILFFHSFRLTKDNDRKIAIYAKASFCSLIAYLIWGLISNAHIDIGWLVLIMIATSVVALNLKGTSKKQLNSRIHQTYLTG